MHLEYLKALTALNVQDHKSSRKVKRFSPEDIQWMLDNHKEYTARSAGLHLNYPTSSIRKKGRDLGIKFKSAR
jgi:hypothetical protein